MLTLHNKTTIGVFVNLHRNITLYIYLLSLISSTKGKQWTVIKSTSVSRCLFLLIKYSTQSKNFSLCFIRKKDIFTSRGFVFYKENYTTLKLLKETYSKDSNTGLSSSYSRECVDLTSHHSTHQ